MKWTSAVKPVSGAPATENAPVEPELQPHQHRWSTIVGAAVSTGMLCLALWFLHRELAGLSRQTVIEHARSIPLAALLASALFAACSYAVLTGYDALALRYLDRKVPYYRSAMTSFVAFAVGHNVGVAALSGGSIRFRMYSLLGLSAAEITTLIVFVSTTFMVGASALLGVALLVMPPAHLAVLHLPPAWIKIAAIFLLLIPILYLGLSMWRQRPLEFRNWQVQSVRPKIALTQIVLSVADLMFASATLYVLLEPTLHIGFLPFLSIYLLALAAGLVSNIPGGVGVFEAVLLAALPQVDTSAVLSTVIIYRLVYYVMPLIGALVMLLVHEAWHQRKTIEGPAKKVGHWMTGVAPRVIGLMVFLAGVVLLISGASPGIEARLNFIASGIPLPVLELSHLVGSVVGALLLIIASGLFRRLRVAYVVAMFALLIGIIVSILKGLDYEEALLLGFIGVALWLSRQEFYRQGSIATQRYSMQWILAIVLVMSLVLWVGLISNRHVEYSDQLWWQFALHADAPRMLRASVIAAVTIIAFILWKVLRSGIRVAHTETEETPVDLIQNVLITATDSNANVALLGDKRFFWSKDHKAFIMYQISGGSWIAMGDPVGPEQYHNDLIWSWRELVDRHDGRPVFYQVAHNSLSTYADLGLSFSKLGEDARVPLQGFSLQGSHRADLRQAVNRAKKNGAVFEVVPKESVKLIIDELHQVSNSWLSDKSTAEKGFSVGSFSPRYIEQFDCAVVRSNGVIVAFANLWSARAANELSIDLMRYTSNAPKGVMDYLFAELMLWGAANGYHWFSLGMAPLSGLEQRRLAPLWHKLGHLVFTHGESFYNFEGLRSFKDKFQPVWSAKYLACEGGWMNIPIALVDASRLISGGMGRLLKKDE